MERVGDERCLRGGSCQRTNRARKSPEVSEVNGQPRTLSRTCHSHYGLQRGPSRPWLTRCCGCICPRPSHGTCLPLCTAARGHSHMATAIPMHTITHSYPVLSSGSCSHLHYLGHDAHGHTCMSTPLPTHNILILPYIYVHVHTYTQFKIIKVFLKFFLKHVFSM